MYNAFIRNLFIITTIVCLIIISNLTWKLKEANERNVRLQQKILENKSQISEVEGKLDVLIHLLSDKK